MHSWNTFGARMSHMQTQTHKTHHDLDLGEATTFPLIVYYVPLQEAHIQMTFCPGTPKWESRNSQTWNSRNFWEPITLCVELWSRWGPKQSCSPRQDLSKGMLHITCMQGNRGDSWLLMVGSQIANLTLNLSFGYNLCFSIQMGHASPFQT